VYVDRAGQLALLPKWFSSGEALTRAVERMLHRAGRGGDLERANGLVEARIDGGLLLTCAMPPFAARGPVVTLRRPRRNLQHLADLVGEGVLSQGMADFLDLALKAHRNVVVAGAAGSGRSTLLAALARAAAEAGERVVVVEESEELDLGDTQGVVMQLIGRGPHARQALWNALRLRPERLVIGDVRGAEALDLVGALAGGSDGCLCAVQAGSPRDALAHLAAMARLAPEAPSPATLHEEIGRAVHVVVHLVRSAEGEPRVGEIAEVAAAAGELPTTQAVFSFKPEGGGRFAGTGHVPGWADGAPPSMFR
jgi:pilus assembly protein CpaF